MYCKILMIINPNFSNTSDINFFFSQHNQFLIKYSVWLNNAMVYKSNWVVNVFHTKCHMESGRSVKNEILSN